MSMNNRREFLKVAGLAGVAATAARGAQAVPLAARVVATWDFGAGASTVAWGKLGEGGSSLDAVEAGARWAEADLCNSTVGHCGYPDRDGKLTLDASIMDGDLRCGGVGALEDIMHPVSVARAVMERSPHVLLVGAGAQEFALQQGFVKTPLLTPQARQAWEQWRKSSQQPSQPDRPHDDGAREVPGGPNRHDTLGILAVDAYGHLAGACTTSGMAWKLHGRVGDSPIIGAGLYVDNEVGAATASGVGEEMLRNAASFLVVELMRQGHSPSEACRLAIARVVRRRPAASRNEQVCFLALNRHGEVGAFALHRGFVYAVRDAHNASVLQPARSVYRDVVI
jgi:N4-(beta-N-acetylglucosaminyl)-L-asparaginase